MGLGENFRAEGEDGCAVSALQIRVYIFFGSAFRFRVSGFRSEDSGFECRIPSFGFGASGLGLGVYRETLRQFVGAESEDGRALALAHPNLPLYRSCSRVWMKHLTGCNLPVNSTSYSLTKLFRMNSAGTIMEYARHEPPVGLPTRMQRLPTLLLNGDETGGGTVRPFGSLLARKLRTGVPLHSHMSSPMSLPAKPLQG